MKRNLVLSLGLGLLIFGGTVTQSRTAYAQTQASATDTNFLSEVAQANMAEIQAGELALSRSNNVNLKRLARMVIDDHTMAQESVKSIGMGWNMTNWPSSPDTMHQEAYADLERLNGSSFDHAYIKNQIKAHKKAIWAFQNQLNESNDPQVKTFARGILPTLRRHLEEFKYLKTQCSNWW